MDFTELLQLAADASDIDRKEITARITEMSSDERIALIQAMQTLGDCYDAAVFDLHLRRD
jgi:hypothetical protein